MEEYPDGRRGYAAIDSRAGAGETRVAASKNPRTEGKTIFLRNKDTGENKMAVYSFRKIGDRRDILQTQVFCHTHQQAASQT